MRFVRITRVADGKAVEIPYFEPLRYFQEGPYSLDNGLHYLWLVGHGLAAELAATIAHRRSGRTKGRFRVDVLPEKKRKRRCSQ